MVLTEAAGPDECELGPIATGIVPPTVFSRCFGFEKEHRGFFVVRPVEDGHTVAFVNELAVERRTAHTYFVVPFEHNVGRPPGPYPLEFSYGPARRWWPHRRCIVSI